VETELMLADLESLEKRVPNLQKKARGGQGSQGGSRCAGRALDLLRDGKPAR
jgi:ribosome-binding ATPase YchF (GTP1/OBG family)